MERGNNRQNAFPKKGCSVLSPGRMAGSQNNQLVRSGTKAVRQKIGKENLLGERAKGRILTKHEKGEDDAGTETGLRGTA